MEKQEKIDRFDAVLVVLAKEYNNEKLFQKVKTVLQAYEKKESSKLEKQAGKVAEKQARKEARKAEKLAIAEELKAREAEFKAQLRAERKARLNAFNESLKACNTRKA